MGLFIDGHSYFRSSLRSFGLSLSTASLSPGGCSLIRLLDALTLGFFHYSAFLSMSTWGRYQY